MSLKPCPFCGNSDPARTRIEAGFTVSRLICDGCGGCAPWPPQGKSPESAWNTRTPETESAKSKGKLHV